MTSEGRWNLPSLLSVSRIVLTAVIVPLLLSDDPDHRAWAVVVLLAGVATDFFDGYLARRLHQVTEFGKMIDPVADKIAIAVIFGTLTVTGDLEWWLTAVVIGRDLLLLAGAAYIRRSKRITVQSNWPGKIAVTAMAVLALLGILRLEVLSGFRVVTLWFTLAMVGMSLGLYARRLFVGVRAEPQKGS
jgi:CDP-diacylglycerol--glycerol-3-phosphate 3-phosphatidyltransferase